MKPPITKTILCGKVKAGAICACFMFLILMQCTAQQLQFDHLNVENGLSQNSVLAIAQDHTGFMWYGTTDGLNRYDGSNFRVYRIAYSDTVSISGNYINALLVGSDHTLWIGTTNGLDKYDAEHDSFLRIMMDSTTSNSLSWNNISCIYEDRKGNIWVGTTNGLNRLAKGKTNIFQQYFHTNNKVSLASNNVRCIFEDHAGNLWIGTADGLTKMSWKNNDYIYETFRHEAGQPNSLSDDYITTIAEDKQQNLWIGTLKGGVNELIDRPRTTDDRPRTTDDQMSSYIVHGSSPVVHGLSSVVGGPSSVAPSFIHFMHKTGDANNIIHNNIRKIFCDKTGKLWIGTQDGLTIMDPLSKDCVTYQYVPEDKKSLSQNSIYSIFQDASGSVWLGTYYGGTNVVYSSNTVFINYQNSSYHSSISNNVITTFAEDAQHNLWIGTEGGGLNYFNRQTGLFNNYKNKPEDSTSLGSNQVKLVYIDRAHNLWVGTRGGGLNLFDAKYGTSKRVLYKKNDHETSISEITTLMEDHLGRLWVGTSGGLWISDTTKKIFALYNIQTPNGELSKRTVFCILEDRAQNIWVGTVYGLYLLRKNTQAFTLFPTNYRDSSNLQSSRINCIFQDSKGRIWIGSYNGGIGSYNSATNNFTNYTEKNGLPNSRVLGILEDDKGFLWVSTGNGLCKFDPGKKTFKTYTTSDGLPGNGFNINSFFKSSSGEMFFGGFNGFTSFFPDKIETNNYAPPVAFTSLKMFNKSIKIDGEDRLLSKDINSVQAISFHHDQNVFTIGFAMLNYIKSNKNRYAYMLEGFDKDWNETVIPLATYTNLPSGNYTFLVKGANNDGIWSPISSLVIKVLPPWWATWWAYCIYILLLAAILFLVARFFFLRELLKKEDELHQAKLNFFTNISHEIRTHLTLIMAPLDKIFHAKDSSKFLQEQSANAKGNAHRLLNLVNELMDFRKAETNHLALHIGQYDLVAFLQEIYNTFQELALAKNIHMRFVHNKDIVLLYFDKEQLEKVFFNLLTNAFKFTPAGGQIHLLVEQQAEKVSIKVSDNGRGIAPQHLDKLFTNFFQVADHGVQNTGYGIGLALSKHIVELHHGTITVESVPSTGTGAGQTDFIVTLLVGDKHFEAPGYTMSSTQPERTVAEMPVMVEAEVQNLPAEENITGNKGERYNVLIVEDTDELRMLIRETLQGRYNILESGNGVQGLELATEQIPHLIISDVMMPEMDGLTLCTKLKTDERTSHIPVILLTAKSSQADQVSGLETGADVYLTKPFSPRALELNVRNLLASRERMREKFSRQVIPPAREVPAIVEEREWDYLSPVDKAFLDRVIRFVEDHLYDPDFSAALLSAKVGMNQPVLYKKIKAITSLSLNDFIKSLRLRKAAELLQEGKLRVSDIAFTVGYSDRRYFSREFKKQFGKLPSEYAGGMDVVGEDE